MISMATIVVLFVLGVNIANHDLWGTQDWFIGNIGGIAIAISWARSRALAVLLSVAGLLLLVVTASGAIPPLVKETKSLVNGMSLGFLLGLLINLKVYWPKSGQLIRRVAEEDADHVALSVLDRLGIK